MKTKTFKMVDISNTILPKEVKNELIEVRERRGAFEKNTALRRMAPKPKASYIETAIIWIVGLSIIGVILWGSISGHGGY